VIDRVARNRAALALRRFAADRITNDDFESEYPASTPDDGVRRVAERAWSLYDDYRAHLLGSNPQLRREITRWVLFLHSDEEYRWPRYSFIQIRLPALLNLLTGTWFNRRQDARFKAFARAGDFTVWPFLDADGYERAKTRPRYFTGPRL
jgi:hypothetical protein